MKRESNINITRSPCVYDHKKVASFNDFWTLTSTSLQSEKSDSWEGAQSMVEEKLRP